MAYAGDVNGDGFDDVLVGATSYDVVSGTSVLTSAGRVDAYYGDSATYGDSPEWQVLGDQENGYLGISVAGVGDVNNDGFDDVVIGEHGYDVLTAGDNRGRMHLFLGSPDGLADTPDQVISGTINGMLYAEAVSGAGDVNGDGYADVIVSARQYLNAAGRRGRVWVYLGSASGLVPTAHFVVISDAYANYFGYSISTAGDVNDDGYDDVAVGSFQYAPTGTDPYGAIFVWYGSDTGLDDGDGTAASADWRAVSRDWGSDLGYAVSTQEMSTGTGTTTCWPGPGYMAGSPAALSSAGTGRSTARSLASPVTPGSGGYDWKVAGESGHFFGTSIAAAGDTDGDGYDDVIVGSYGSGTPPDDYTGATPTSFSGSGPGLATASAWSREGAVVDTRLRRSRGRGRRHKR